MRVPLQKQIGLDGNYHGYENRDVEEVNSSPIPRQRSVSRRFISIPLRPRTHDLDNGESASLLPGLSLASNEGTKSRPSCSPFAWLALWTLSDRSAVHVVPLEHEAQCMIQPAICGDRG